MSHNGRDAVQQEARTLLFQSKECTDPMETVYSLEVIATHFAIETITLHAFEAPISEILTGVVVFARIFTGDLVSWEQSSNV